MTPDPLAPLRDVIARHREKKMGGCAYCFEPHPCDAFTAATTALRWGEALQEIEKGEGPFNRDNYVFACNVIEAAKEKARDALRGERGNDG